MVVNDHTYSKSSAIDFDRIFFPNLHPWICSSNAISDITAQKHDVAYVILLICRKSTERQSMG